MNQSTGYSLQPGTLKSRAITISREAQLLWASHCHAGDDHTYRRVKDVKPLKAVADMEVI